MMRYDLAKLSQEQFPNRRKRTIQLRPLSPPLKIQREYRRELRNYLKELKTYTENFVVPQVEAHMAMTQDVATLDREHWFEGLRDFERRIRQTLISFVANLSRNQAKRHRERFTNEVKTRLGIDIKAVVREEDMEEALSIHSARNASLISSLGSETIKKVEQTIYRHQLGEVGFDNLSKMLQKDFHLSRVRADLIATDQVQKLGADLNRMRQEQAGITTYLWRTSKDERVRSRHRELDGKIYHWGKPTGAEEGLPPGKPIRCRCVAIAQIEIGQ